MTPFQTWLGGVVTADTFEVALFKAFYAGTPADQSKIAAAYPALFSINQNGTAQ